ncbi:MAG: NAD(P)H-dependent oxidoreductase [Proteobacteria bacterium]|nr:NAD(P)H-dependent oxidoreductase [Pseudomonadota bacterium]
MKCFAISGSLRAQSGNTALLEALKRFAPPSVAVEIFHELELIPPFNPDRENQEPPAAVAHFRESLKNADVVLFSTPEYAHGVPGVLKNALDWVVGSGELYEKPIAILQTSTTRGANALASLKATLAIMRTKLLLQTVLEPGANGTFENADAVRAALAEIVTTADAQPKE